MVKSVLNRANSTILDSGQSRAKPSPEACRSPVPSLFFPDFLRYLRVFNDFALHLSTRYLQLLRPGCFSKLPPASRLLRPSILSSNSTRPSFTASTLGFICAYI
ncbi:hypothetical protein CRG98_043543 [Punica granatum]|uniref:Uncharacterized protein n=1 Tax=Punica granatum TaxID=22663 RepID=A0A2I0HWK3_PUNGR|nr:hypothetical protein CRG98_043543 [Punica granatum]